MKRILEVGYACLSCLKFIGLGVFCKSMYQQHMRYPTGQKHSLELMFAKCVTIKIGKDLIPLKVFTNRCLLPENNCDEV